jgi:hypothetical protein
LQAGRTNRVVAIAGCIIIVMQDMMVYLLSQSLVISLYRNGQRRSLRRLFTRFYLSLDN